MSLSNTTSPQISSMPSTQGNQEGQQPGKHNRAASPASISAATTLHAPSETSTLVAEPASQPPHQQPRGHLQQAPLRPGLPDPAMKWGYTPKSSSYSNWQDISELPADHPVHRWTSEEQEAMRKKGINPMLKAEVDAAVTKDDGSTRKRKSFWRKYGLTGLFVR